MKTGANTNLFIQLTQVLKEYRKISFQAVEEYGFTPSEIDVLMFLFNNAPLDTAKNISKYRGISKTLVSRSVDSLIKRGLLSTSVDAQDRRIIHLTLNKNAADIVEKLQISKDFFIRKVTEGIDKEDIDIFMKVILEMQNNIQHLKNINFNSTEEK